MTEADISKFTDTMQSSPDATAIGALLGLGAGLIIFVCIIGLAIIVLEIIGLVKTFKKAGEPGWAAIIPFYNFFVLIKIAKLEWWHFLIVIAITALTTVENDTVSGLAGLAYLVYLFVINIKLTKAFGRGAGLGVVCTLFPYIGYMILGCGSAKYEK